MIAEPPEEPGIQLIKTLDPLTDVAGVPGVAGFWAARTDKGAV